MILQVERNFLRGDSRDSLENRQAVKNILKNIKLDEQKQHNSEVNANLNFSFNITRTNRDFVKDIFFISFP